MSNEEYLQKATFGAGCFWCVEAIFQQLKGVQSVKPAYSGGETEDPSYRQVCSGNTGHAEVARIVFDPEKISFETLLEVFWSTHNPTTLNRQGNDVGSQYRSAVFYHDNRQKELAEKVRRDVVQEWYEDEVVTEISPLKNYYPAEDYHDNYFQNNPGNAYCQSVVAPKVRKFREKFTDLLKEQVTSH